MATVDMPLSATGRDVPPVALLVVDRDLQLVDSRGGSDVEDLLRDTAGNLQPQAAAWVREVFSTGVPVLGRNLAAAGQPASDWVCSVLPLLEAHGAVRLVQILIQRLDLQEALRAQAQLAAIVQSAHDGIVSKSLDGVVRSWNQSAERLFGYTAEDMIGRNITTIIPEDRLDEEVLIQSRIRKGEQVERYETLRVHKDGHTVPVSLTVSPVRDSAGRIVGASKIVQDISARQEAESVLRRREEELRTITDAVPALIAYVDLDLRYRFNNLAYEHWFGWPRGTIEGCDMRDLLGDSAFEAVLPHLQRALSGEAVRFETWADYRTGGRRYIDATYLPRRDQDGDVEGLFMLVADITAHKEAEESLAKSEARYRTLVNNLSDAMVLADPQRRIVLVNPAFSTIFGYGSDEIIGRSSEVLYADSSDFRRMGEQRYYGEVGPQLDAYEMRYRRQDGSVFWAETRGSAVRDEQGALIGFLGLHRDITDRKRAEDALRESEARFRLMAETMPGVVFTTSAEGWCDYVNTRWYEYTGTEPNAADGFGWLTAVHPDDREPTLEHWKEALAAGTSFEHKYRLRGVDGRYRWTIVRAQPLRDSARSINKWLGVATDIDELVQAQEALKESHRRKDEFLAMLAHELRNPLAPVMTAVEVLQLDSDLLTGRVAWAADIIQRQTLHLTHLVDDLLDIARIVSGRIQLRRSTLDVCALAVQAVDSARPRIQAKGIRLAVTIPDTPLYVFADAGRITQILDNLLDNAAKYTDSGGDMHVAVERSGEDVALRITDTGIGIAPENLLRVFELFEQADPGFDRGSGGLGLGLNLVQRLVNMHGGSVVARSEGLGRGSEFEVRLPLSGSEPDKPAAPVREAAPAGPARKVLVVEDNPDVAESLVALLQGLGHQAVSVPDGPSCLDIAAKDPPELVLLDLGLPGMTGYEIAQALRERLPAASLRLVAITGYGRREDRARARAAGFDDHVLKPVNRETLERILADLAGAQRAP